MSTEPGFSPSIPEELSVTEGVANGTVIGAVISSEPIGGEDLIIDGGFTTTGNTFFVSYDTGRSVGDGWVVTAGSVDINPTRPQSPLGGVAVSLVGTEPGTISQTVSTEPGKSYTLKFALSGEFNFVSEYDVQYVIDGVAASTTVTRPDNWASDNLLWTQRHSTFTATSDSTDISFEALTRDGFRGPLLSDVQLIEVDPDIASVLALNPQLTYDAGTHKFYQIDTNHVDWVTAQANSVARELNGVSGRLVVVRDAYENSVVQGLAQSVGENVFLGATDQTTEGEWRWHTGTEDGDLLWSGNYINGSAPNGAYTNWRSVEPNDSGTGEDYAVLFHIHGDGVWNDNDLEHTDASITEWDANTVLASRTYSIESDPNGALSIDSRTGELTVVNSAAIDFEASPTYDIVVRVTNAVGDYYEGMISIPIVNDGTPEIVNLESDAIEYIENGSPVSVTDTLSISDGDSTNIQSAIVSLTGPANADDRLIFTDNGPFSSSYNSGIGQLSIDGDTSLADWETALRTISYQNVSDAPPTSPRQIQFSVGDGNEWSVVESRTLNITAVNDSPSLADGAFPGTDEDEITDGLTVNDIFAGRFSDADGVFTGIAVVDRASASEGSWEYSVDSGTTWSDIVGLSPSQALFLDVDTQLRFVPDTDYFGPTPSLSVHGIDDSYTGTYTTNSVETLGDVSTHQSISAFSVGTASIQSQVYPDGPTDASGGVSINSDTGNDVYLVANNGGDLLGGLDAFTVEVQFSINSPSAISNPLLSYAIDGKSNELLLVVNSAGTLAMHIDGKRVEASGLYQELLNGDKHSVSVSWSSLHGRVAFYVNGTQVDSTTGIRVGHVLQPDGELVLGQEQDSMLGGFDASQVIRGTYYDLRLWNEVRTEAEIAGNHQHKLYIDTPNATSNVTPGASLIANWQMDGFSALGEVLDVVAGNNLSVGHASGTGFSTGDATAELHVFEDAVNGTVAGVIVPGFPVIDDLVQDGSFTSDNRSSMFIYSAGETIGDANGQWLVENGEVGLAGNWAYSPLGGNAIDLDGDIPGAISQTLSTVPGKTYVVNFAMTGNFNQGPDTKSLSLSATSALSSTSETFTVNRPDGWSNNNLLWSQRSMLFTASAESTTLKFESLSDPGGRFGSAIGDVQVTELSGYVADILAADSALSYNAETDKFYKFVPSFNMWQNAQAEASALTLNSQPGRLVTINSAAENEFVFKISQAENASVWLGASDADTEGQWHWHLGPGDERLFWTGDENGLSFNGAYTNWLSGEPDNDNNEDFAILSRNDGTWNDHPGTDNARYLIEWDASTQSSPYQYSIESDPVGAFAIDSDNGRLSVSNGSILDHETAPSHDLVIRVTDSSGEFHDANITVNVLDVNEPPVLSGIESTDVEFFENDGAVVVSELLGITDVDTTVDNTVLQSASITISSGYRATEDSLGFSDTSNITGNWDATTGTLNLTGTDTIDSWQAALRAVTYMNVSESPVVGARTIEFVVNDAMASSNVVNRDVSVNAVNDAPSLTDGVLGNIPEDTVEPNGEIIKNIFGGRFSDVDGTFGAIAISADATDATNPQGVWQYSTNDGADWYPLDVRVPVKRC